MKKKCLAFILILIISTGFAACSTSKDNSNTQDKGNFQEKKSETKSENLYTVAANICVKDGEKYEDETILTNTDFVGFKYTFSESQNKLFIYFKLNSEGQKKQYEVTKKFTEAPNYISVWVGEELISAIKLWSHNTNDEFVLSIPDINKDAALDFVDKLKEQTDNSEMPQVKVQEPLPDIDDWNKEIISNKPKKAQSRYFIYREDGSEWTLLEVDALTEERDLDNDGTNEILVYLQGDKRNIGIYDVVNGLIKYIDVNSRLGSTWSEYMGNMGNIDSKYLNCIEVGYEEFDRDIHYDVYKYADGKLTYVCPFYDALRK